MDTRVPIIPTDGINRTRTSSQAPVGSFYDLFGFRHDPKEQGRLQQVGYFYPVFTQSQGTYYSGGSQTETTISCVVGQFGGACITDYCAFAGAGGAQVQIFYQTAFPSGNTINKQCNVIVNSVAGLALTLNGALDIVIDGATTFKWRKNGGAYNLAVPITTTGVSIDGGNATVYFLTATGFTIADTWTWTRTDYTIDPAAISFSLGQPLKPFQWRSKTFFVGASGRVMVIEKDTLSVLYIRSVGYNPIYGTDILVFFDHLGVASYASVPTPNVIDTSTIIAWSDLNDLDCFFVTDVNEADQYSLPAASSHEKVLGSFIFQNRWFVCTQTQIFVTSYLGLPTIFSFAKYANLPFGVVSILPYGGLTFVAMGSERGVYIKTKSTVYRFDGSSFTNISAKLGFGLQDAFTNGAVTSLEFYSIHFLSDEKEVWLRASDTNIYCYQETFDVWYKRYGDFAGSNGTGFSSLSIDALGMSSAFLGAANRKLVQIDVAGTQTPMPDSVNGTVYGTPKITTQVLTGGVFAPVKEIRTAYLAPVSRTANSGKYSTGALNVLNLKWYNTDSGIISGSPTANVASIWNSSVTSTEVSLPGISFHGLALQIELTTVTANKPPAFTDIMSIEPLIHNWPKSNPTR